MQNKLNLETLREYTQDYGNRLIDADLEDNLAIHKNQNNEYIVSRILLTGDKINFTDSNYCESLKEAAIKLEERKQDQIKDYSNLSKKEILGQLKSEAINIESNITEISNSLDKIDKLMVIVKEQSLFGVDELEIQNDKELNNSFENLGENLNNINLSNKEETIDILNQIQSSAKKGLESSKDSLLSLKSKIDKLSESQQLSILSEDQDQFHNNIMNFLDKTKEPEPEIKADISPT